MRRLAVLLLAASVLVPVALCPPAFAQGDWEVKRDPFDRRVVAQYKQLLARNPSDKAALRKLTSLYERYRSLDQLIQEYERELSQNKDNASAAVILGHIYLGRGDRERALSYYQRGAQLRPGDAAVHLALAELHKQSNQPAEARAAYERALASTKSKPVEKEAVRALAELSLAQGDIDGARSFYERYFALDPQNVQARIELGDALSQQGRHQQAIEVLGEAETRLRSDPARQVEVIARIGAAHEAAGQEDEAIRAYRRAMSRVDRTYYLRKELTGRIIEIHRRRQALPELVAQYEKDWSERQRGHFEWDVLARLYEETGNQERAIAAFRMATKKAPYELDTQRRLIALLEHSGRDDEALAQYEAVIRVAPGEPRFQLELAERYWRRGNEKQALALLAKVEQRFPSDGGVHAAIADLYTRWGKPDLALKAYVHLTRIEPEDVDHLINLGEQYYQRNDKKQAMAVWKKILARKTAASYARLGEVYAEHDLLTDALAMYDKAVQLEPKQAEHFKGRASVHERRRDFHKAVSDWETVLALMDKTNAAKPQRAEARRRVVSLLKRAQGNALRQRIDNWKLAFYANTPDIEAGYFLVEAYLREQRYDQARRTLERLLTLDKNDIEAMEQLVKVYQRELKYDEAVALLERLAALSPARQREYYDQIAEIKTADRKDEEAIHYAQKALEQSPNDPLAYQRLAERYEEMQRFDKAITAYEKTIELDPRNFKASFALAQLYTHSNAPDKAAALYRHVLRQATDEEILTRAGREAIDLEEMTRTLGELERTLAPLAFTFGHKPIYRRILVQLYFRYVPGLVRTWHRGNPAERAAARAELDRLGAHGLKPLLEALSDESDPHQQRIAVAVLGYLGNKGAAAPLVRLAMQSGVTAGATQPRIGALTPALDWDVRIDALVAAGRLGDERTIDDLVQLAEHKETTMREAALFALGRTGNRKALPALTAALHRPSEPEQVLACLGLAQVGAGDRRTMAELAAVVQGQPQGQNQTPGELARAACAFALGSLAAPAGQDALIHAVTEGNGELTRMAAWALGRIGDKRAIPALLGAYFGRHVEVRQTVRWALAAIATGRPAATAEAARPAVNLGEYPTRLGRYDAKAMLRALPGELDAVRLPASVLVGHEAEIAAGLRDALGRHRDLLVRVLGDLDSAPDHLALGSLTGDLATAPQAEQTRIRQVLGRVGQSILPQLSSLISHRDAAVRSMVLSVVAKIDSPESHTLLLTGLKDEVASVRVAAMDAAATHVRLHDQGGPALARAIAARLEDKDWQGRTSAARVLGDLGKYGDVAALAQAAKDANAYVREQAILSLGRLIRAGVGRDRALEVLLQATADELAVIRLAAVTGLTAADARDSQIRERLRRIAESDPDEQVARAARKLLEKPRK